MEVGSIPSIEQRTNTEYRQPAVEKADGVATPLHTAAMAAKATAMPKQSVANMLPILAKIAPSMSAAQNSASVVSAPPPPPFSQLSPLCSRDPHTSQAQQAISAAQGVKVIVPSPSLRHRNQTYRRRSSPTTKAGTLSMLAELWSQARFPSKCSHISTLPLATSHLISKSPIWMACLQSCTAPFPI